MITKKFIKERTSSYKIKRVGKEVKLFHYRFGSISIQHCSRVAECDYYDEHHYWSDVYVENVSYYDHVHENGTKIGRAENLNEFITVVQDYYKRNPELWAVQKKRL